MNSVDGSGMSGDTYNFCPFSSSLAHPKDGASGPVGAPCPSDPPEYLMWPQENQTPTCSQVDATLEQIESMLDQLGSRWLGGTGGWGLTGFLGLLDVGTDGLDTPLLAGSAAMTELLGQISDIADLDAAVINAYLHGNGIANFSLAEMVKLLTKAVAMGIPRSVKCADGLSALTGQLTGVFLDDGGLMCQ